MANIIKCFNLVLGYKGNKYKRYKWILVLLKFKRPIKKNKGKNKEKGGKVRLSIKHS